MAEQASPETEVKQTNADDPATLRAALTAATRERDAERAEKEALRNQVSDRDRRLAGETAGRFQAEETAVDNAIAAATNELANLQAQLTAAWSEAKHDVAAQLQIKIGKKSAELDRFEQRKEWIAQQKDAASKQPVVTDPREAFIKSYPENVQGWIRNNPRFIDDARYRQLVVGADSVAKAKGFQPGTADYFKFIEDRAAQDMGEAQSSAQTAPAADVSTPSSQEEDMDQGVIIEPSRPAPQPSAVPANARPENPQGRAAGPGALASIASRPTRGATPGTRQGPPRLTPEQAEAAITLAASLRPEMTNQADIYKWYYEMNNSPSAQRHRREWAAA